MLKARNKARLPLALFIGFSDLHVIKLVFVLTRMNPRTRFADYHVADKTEFRLTMLNFYRKRVERVLIQPIEWMLPENEKPIAELAEYFGWRDEWLRDEELCQKQTEMHAMMTSFARTQSETLFELMKQNALIKSVPVAIPMIQLPEMVGERPDNGNDPVPFSGCVFEGMAEALGIEISHEALSS